MATTLYNINDDPQILLDHYNKYGVIAVTGILNEQQIIDTHRDIENLLKKECNENFSFDDPDTYNTVDQYVNRYGCLDNRPLFTTQLMKNRLNTNLRKIYSILYELPENELTPSHDRVAWMRPTIGPNYEDWKHFDTPFEYPGLHLDIDPSGYFNIPFSKQVSKSINMLTYNDTRDFISENNAKHITMGRSIQGIINLFDNEEEDGGFHCFPEGHIMVEKWYNDSKEYLPSPSTNGRYIFKQKTKNDAIFFNTTRIPCPAGTAILFDATLPHGTKPNRSQNNRMIQFARYTPKKIFDTKTFLNRQKTLLKICNNISYPLTEQDMEIL